MFIEIPLVAFLSPWRRKATGTGRNVEELALENWKADWTGTGMTGTRTGTGS